jgi:hypothetical protein
MRILLLMLLYLNCINSQAQEINLNYLDKIVKVGLCKTESENCIQNQIEYISASKKLGDYYYKMKKYKKAFKYYMLSANLGVYTDGELQDDRPIRLRNIVSAKAGDMYFYGLGVERNIKMAFLLHYHVPVFYDSSLRAKYSKLYFKNTNRFHIISKNNSSSDSSICIGINPFYITEKTTPVSLNYKLNNIKTRMEADTTLQCKVELTYGILSMNIINQSYLSRFLDDLKEYFPKNLLDRTSFEIIPKKDGCLYKSLILPKLIIDFH